MIVAKVSRGSSFKGLTAYLANPREGEHRAEWTATQNIGTDNVFMAARVMAASAMDADALKRAHGWEGRGRGTTDKPVQHYIVSWDETRQPDHAHQQQAARDLLKAIGLEKAQAVMVGHTDNGKTHLHIALNVLDPETGKQFDLGNEKRKMQEWALQYCRQHVIDVAPNREKNAAEREAAKMEARAVNPQKIEGTKRLSRQEWLAMKEALELRHAGEREALKASQGVDWTMAKAEIEQRRKASETAYRREHEKQKAIAQEQNRPFWRDMFKQHKAEERFSQGQIAQALKTERAAKSFLGRAAAFMGLGQRADHAEAKVSFFKMQHEALLARHEYQRKAAAAVHRQDVHERTKAALPPLERLDLSNMKTQHQKEWEQTRARQAAEREAAGLRPYARDRDKERDQARRDAPSPPPDDTEQRAEAARHERLRENITRAEQLERQAKSGRSNDETFSQRVREAARRRDQERKARDRDSDDFDRER